jgi:Flp pilus assembly protein TadD
MKFAFLEKEEKMQKKPISEKELDLIEMAKFYFMNSKYDEAIEELNKVLEVNPKNAEAYYNLGLIYEHKNQKEDARNMYEKALNIDPEYKLAREHINKLMGI